MLLLASYIVSRIHQNLKGIEMFRIFTVAAISFTTIPKKLKYYFDMKKISEKMHY